MFCMVCLFQTLLKIETVQMCFLIRLNILWEDIPFFNQESPYICRLFIVNVKITKFVS